MDTLKATCGCPSNPCPSLDKKRCQLQSLVIEIRRPVSSERSFLFSPLICVEYYQVYRETRRESVNKEGEMGGCIRCKISFTSRCSACFYVQSATSTQFVFVRLLSSVSCVERYHAWYPRVVFCDHCNLLVPLYCVANSNMCKSVFIIVHVTRMERQPFFSV